jgi:hypothetical protein
MTVLVPGILVAARYVIRTCPECRQRFRARRAQRYCTPACQEQHARSYQAAYQPKYRRQRRQNRPERPVRPEISRVPEPSHADIASDGPNASTPALRPSSCL